MLSVAGKCHREDFTLGAFTHQLDGRVLHGEFGADIAIDPFHGSAFPGLGAFGHEIVNVFRPILDRRIAAATVAQDDDFDDR